MHWPHSEHYLELTGVSLVFLGSYRTLSYTISSRDANRSSFSPSPCTLNYGNMVIPVLSPISCLSLWEEVPLCQWKTMTDFHGHKSASIVGCLTSWGCYHFPYLVETFQNFLGNKGVRGEQMMVSAFNIYNQEKLLGALAGVGVEVRVGWSGMQICKFSHSTQAPSFLLHCVIPFSERVSWSFFLFQPSSCIWVWTP